MNQGIRPPTVPVIVLLVSIASFHTGAARAAARPAGGVTVWASEGTFAGTMKSLEGGEATVVATEPLPHRLRGNPVLATDTLVGAGNSATGELALYTRTGDRLVRRCAVRPDRGRGPVRFQVVPDRQRAGVGIEVQDHQGRVQYAAFFSPEGLVRFQPGRVQTLRIADAGLAYAVVPSLIGTDLVYDPRDYPDKDRLYIPSLSMVVGLAGTNDCMMVGVWPPGGQVARLELDEGSGRKVVDGISLTLAGESFYLRLLEQDAIWHVQALKPGFLETDTVISWKRPLEARWIGHFFVESEGIYYPFYFRHKRERIWGRFIRSWYYYPCWFDGDKTYIHFEKKFPPQGEMLIYYLEVLPGTREIASPVGVLEEALGADLASRLLDREGIEHRPLLAHGDAVCAMTNKMQAFFEAGQEVNQRLVIIRRADDVADFIRMIRERAFEYGAFAARTEKVLKDHRQADADLAPCLAPLESTIEEIGVAAREDLPDVSLAEVRTWTEEIKGLADQVRPTNLERYKVLSRQCRQVAGAQDDLTRDLSILTIRLMQEAASMGVDSPERVRLAEEIIAACRRILRRPTWWEPRRYYVPKADPGRP